MKITTTVLASTEVEHDDEYIEDLIEESDYDTLDEMIEATEVSVEAGLQRHFDDDALEMLIVSADIEDRPKDL